MTVDEIDVAANFLVKSYSADLDNDLATELNFFASILKSNFIVKENEEATEVWMFRAAMSNSSLQNTMPNVITMLKIFLTIMMTNCSGERSFSVLKRVKHYLRSTMSQQRLSDLSLLAIEHGLLESLPMDDIISRFAAIETRKMTM